MCPELHSECVYFEYLYQISTTGEHFLSSHNPHIINIFAAEACLVSDCILNISDLSCYSFTHCNTETSAWKHLQLNIIYIHIVTGLMFPASDTLLVLASLITFLKIMNEMKNRNADSRVCVRERESFC